MARRVLPLVGWLTLLAALAVGLAVLGRGALSSPPISPAGWTTWAADRGPAAAALAVVRLAALALAAYLFVASAVVGVIALVRERPPVDLADLLLLPAVRHAVWAAAGLGVAGSAVAVAAAGAPKPVPVLAPAADEVAPRVSTARPPEVHPPDPPAVAAAQLAPPVQAPDAPVALPPSGIRRHPIGPGEHLWAIAERVLAEQLGRVPAEGEVAAYWRLVVDHNRGRLRDPGNPDLVFPGDEVELPVPSGG